MIANSHFPAPGTVVGCEYRWPYDCCHPDCWAEPHKGVVLAMDDPRAGKGTLAFATTELPPQDAVTEHVEKCLKLDLFGKRDKVPVLWTSTIDGKEFVQWDSKLRPYEEELAAWKKARQERYRTPSKPTSQEDVS